MPVSTIAPRRTDAGGLRLLTHNIYERRAGWEDRRRVLIDGIRELDPDLVCFQETSLTDDYDQARDVLGAAYQIVHSLAREPSGQGISIGSRWPISDVRELDLNLTPRTGEFACTTLIARIEAPDPIEPLLLVNHFPDYQVDHEHERELQTVLAAREIEETVAGGDLPVILAGDLDAEPDAASLRFLAGRQSLDGLSVCYVNAWEFSHPGEPGRSFTTRNPLSPHRSTGWPFHWIDHIYVRCGRRGGPSLSIAACELAFDQPLNGIWASDHFALVADLVPAVDPATAWVPGANQSG